MDSNYKNILITGGAGFVGSSVAVKIKKRYPDISVCVIDNLRRRGSELNIERLANHGISFFHGDIRNREDLDCSCQPNLIVECSAEPSVLSGYGSSADYLINTNLVGTLNCLELAKKYQSHFVFLSTSRVYPISLINSLNTEESSTRFTLSDEQQIQGASTRGISEKFPLLDAARSLYGATKLASEIMIMEYIDSFGIKGIVNRCGILTGPWQMGKVDQGVVVFWLASHLFNRSLEYIGFNGSGKQVRDFLHVDDLFELLDIQLKNIDKYNNQVFNVGGGRENSFSLVELTSACREVTGKSIEVLPQKEQRPGDIAVYLSDCTKIRKLSGWAPKIGLKETLTEIDGWISDNRKFLEKIL